MKPQLVNFQLTGGVDEKTSSPWASTPDMLENCRYAKVGALTKRFGLSSLTTPDGTGGLSLADYVEDSNGYARLLGDTGRAYQEGASSDFFATGAAPNVLVTQTTRRGDAFRVDGTTTEAEGPALLADTCFARNDAYRIEAKLIPSAYFFASATGDAQPTAYTLEVCCYFYDSNTLAFAPVVLEDCIPVSSGATGGLRTYVRCIYDSVNDSVHVHCLFPVTQIIRSTAVKPWNGTASAFTTIAVDVDENVDFDLVLTRVSDDGTNTQEARAIFYFSRLGARDARVTIVDHTTGIFYDWLVAAGVANSTPVAISADFWLEPTGTAPTFDKYTAATIWKRTSGAGAAFTLKMTTQMQFATPAWTAPPFNWHNAVALDEDNVLHTGNTGATPTYPVDYYTGCVVRYTTYQTVGEPYCFFNSQLGVEWYTGELPVAYASNWPFVIRSYVRCAWAVARPFVFEIEGESRMMLPAMYRHTSTPNYDPGPTAGLLLDVTTVPDSGVTIGGYLVATYAIDQMMARGGRTMNPTAGNVTQLSGMKQPSINPSTTAALRSGGQLAYFPAPLTASTWMGIIKVELGAATMRFASSEFVGVGGRPTLLQGNGSLGEIGFFGQAAPDYVELFSAGGVSDPRPDDGTYQYVFVWGYVDATGRRQQSFATLPYRVTLTLQSPFFAIPRLDASARARLWFDDPTTVAPVTQLSGFDIVYCEVYRTQASGAVFYLHSRFDTDTLQTTGNELDVGFDFRDVKKDDELNYSISLDTSFYHYTPPSSSICTKVSRRIFCITEDGQIWPSEILTAVTAPRFDIATAFYWDAEEPITAVEEMDGKYFFFTQNQIWVTAEAGNGGLVPFEQIATDIGCVDTHSCLTTPVGLFFNSRVGLATITRGLQVVRSGMNVEDTQESRGIKAAILVPDLNEARFSIDTPDGETVLIFDYLNGTPESPVWYVYTYGDTPFVTWSLTRDKVPVMVEASGFSVESRENYRDFSTDWVTMKVRTSTLRGGTPVSFLGAVASTVQLGGFEEAGVTLTLYADYVSVPSGFTLPTLAATWTAAEIAALPRKQLTATTTSDLEVTCALAVQYEDYDNGDTVTGAGFTLSSAVLRLGQRTDDDVIPQPAGSRK